MRNIWLDNTKFFLMFLVVLGHVALLVNNNVSHCIYLFIYAFHMPLFFMIAGYFHKDKDVGRRAVYLMTIGFLLKILLFGELLWFGKKVGFSVLGGSSIAWFMFALAVFVVITSKLQNINKRLFCVVAIIIACFSGYDKSIGDWLYLSRIIVFYPFYLLGHVVAEKKLGSINKKLFWTSIVALLCWLFIVVNYTSSLYPYKSFLNGNRYFISQMWEYGYLYRALYYVIATTLSIGFISLIPKKHLPFITTAGKRTMAIFFWHIPVLHILLSLGLLNKSNCGIFLQVIIAASLTMILSGKYSEWAFTYLKDKV